MHICTIILSQDVLTVLCVGHRCKITNVQLDLKARGAAIGPSSCSSPVSVSCTKNSGRGLCEYADMPHLLGVTRNAVYGPRPITCSARRTGRTTKTGLVTCYGIGHELCQHVENT